MASTITEPTAPPSFTVTTTELRVLADVAVGGAIGAMEGADSDLVDGLVRRGLLRRDPDALVLPDDAVGGAIEIVTRSHVQFHLRHVPADGEPAGSTWFAVTPKVTIELREHPDGWHIEAFATRHVLVRVVAAVALVERRPVDVEPFQVTGVALEQCADHLALGDRPGAEAALVDEHTPPVSARAFLGALAARLATNVVMRSTPSSTTDPGARRDTRAFTWLDALDWGLWKVPLPDPGAIDRTTIAPLTAYSVCVALAQLLPVDDDPGWRAVTIPFASTGAAAR